MSKQILVLGYGNPSRGDDALGPLLLEYIERNLTAPSVELITDFQLQVEHALDMQDRELVLFIDAAVGLDAAFAFTELAPARDHSYSSHAISPAAVLQVYRTVTGQAPPPAFLLSIQAREFELGCGLSALAEGNLRCSESFVMGLFSQPEIDSWRQACGEYNC